MALTPFQLQILNDIDLFHDTEEAVAKTSRADTKQLVDLGYSVETVREGPGFLEVIISNRSETTAIQWVRDSAFRFFPLVEDELLGLALHPFDLATNKVLAMAGRLEVRDWIDVLTTNEKLQPFGYIAWAACGKDPGYNPRSLISAARRMHYSQVEVDTLDFERESPDAALLGRQWHEMIAAAEQIFDLLPLETLGRCVLSQTGEFFRGAADQLDIAIQRSQLLFHKGSIGGAWPPRFRLTT